MSRFYLKEEPHRAMPKLTLALAAFFASTLALSACAPRNATTLKSDNSNSTTATLIGGERYDPAVEEAVTNGSLKAWRTALKHDKKGEMSDKDWQKIRESDEKDSMSQLHALVDKYPNASYLKTMMGQVKQHFGKKEEAARYYEEAMMQNRRDPLLIFKLAETKKALGQTEQAITYYRNVIKIQPDFLPARLGLAACLSKDKTGQQESKNILEDLVRKDPQNSEAKELLQKLL